MGKSEAASSDTARYRTRNGWLGLTLPAKEGRCEIGFDGGYSSTIGCSAAGMSMIPSLAVEQGRRGASFRQPGEDDIEYREKSPDGTMHVWSVGEMAYREHAKQSATSASRHGMRWFASPMFRVLFRTTAGLALVGGPKCDGPRPSTGSRVMVETGLPPEDYEDETLRQDLRRAIAGRHTFELRVGGGAWMPFDFAIADDDVVVGRQAIAALMAVSVLQDGRPAPGCQRFFRSRVQVIDLGSVTGDVVTLANGEVLKVLTLRGSVMDEVMQRTCRELETAYPQAGRVSVDALHEALESGSIRMTVDRENMVRKLVPVAEPFKKSLKAVFAETFAKIREESDSWEEVDIIIAEGGTYEAWHELFEERFKDAGIEIVPGNVNVPNMPLTHVNAYGYRAHLMRKQ